MLLALTAIVILRYVILPEYTKSATSEVKISPAELNTLQVKAKITTVLYKVEKMKMTEACQLLSKISEREVKPSFFDSYPSKRDFLDVVGLYLESFVKRGGENIKVPIEYWIQTYCNAAIKYARPVINATNIFVAVWTETLYPDVSKLKLLQTEGQSS
jgi:DNA-directed RNA polymerase